MPEMPEVESLARWLTERTTGLDVVRVDVLAISALKTFSPAIDTLCGRTVKQWTRRGKFLVLDVDGLFCCIHLARAGWLRWQDELTTATAKLTKGPQALRMRFSDGAGFTATEAGTEKRLQVHVVESPDDVEQIRTLGIDPFDTAFTAERLGDILSGHGRSQIKGVLTEQGVIAGVGNAYSDEALHVAHLSPFKPANSLTPVDVTVLRDAIVSVLGDAIERSRGKPASELKDAKRSGMRVHGRVGQPCPVCGDTVREVSFSSKSLQYCATCQTGGKPLADRRLSRLLK